MHQCEKTIWGQPQPDRLIWLTLKIFCSFILHILCLIDWSDSSYRHDRHAIGPICSVEVRVLRIKKSLMWMLTDGRCTDFEPSQSWGNLSKLKNNVCTLKLFKFEFGSQALKSTCVTYTTSLSAPEGKFTAYTKSASSDFIWRFVALICYSKSRRNLWLSETLLRSSNIKIRLLILTSVQPCSVITEH